jgi:phage terminase large subunit GpA-like protein
VIGNAIGFIIDMDPSPILMMQPTLDDAARWSKKKFMPMVRASPRLRDKIGEARPGDARNTILLKTGPGWSLSIVGAKSRARCGRTRSATSSPTSAPATTRSAGEGRRPFPPRPQAHDDVRQPEGLTGSTPTVKPDPIDAEYEDSDQRQLFVACPQCGAEQVLKFENLRWEKEGEKPNRRHLTETAHFVCVASGCVIEEKHKRAMVQQARWIPQKPGHLTRGYDLWQAYSLFAKASWKIIAAEWVAAQEDPEVLKNFLNTVLAQSYEERGERPDAESLGRDARCTRPKSRWASRSSPPASTCRAIASSCS